MRIMIRGAAMMTIMMTVVAPPLAAEEVTISGRVVGAAGEAVEGAHVAARHLAAEELQWAEVTADAEGRFTLRFETERPSDSYRVVGVADGLAFLTASAEPGEEVEIALTEPGEPVTGTVVDADGAPVAGADVSASLWATAGQGRHVYVGGWEHRPAAVTDEDGRFSIAGPPPGAHVALRVEAEGYADHYRGTPENWPVTGSDVEIELIAEAVIAGRITRGGELVEGVRVGAQAVNGGMAGEAHSGPDGSYVIHGLSGGTFNVAVHAPEGWTTVAHEKLQIEAGERVEGIDFELIEGSLVRGTVTWADTGDPVPEASVGAYGPAHPMSGAWVQRVETDADGRCELRLPPGEQYVYWMGRPFDAWYAEPRNVTLTLGEDAVETVNFTLHRKPTIAITVLNPDRGPAEGVPVYWQGEGRYGSGSVPEPVLTDAEGRVEVAFGRPMHERARAMAAAVAQDVERDLAGAEVIDAEVQREATIRLVQGAYVTGSAETAEGEPIVDVGVEVSTEREGWDTQLPVSAATDEEGRFRLGPLPTGMALMIGPSWDYRSNVLSPDLQHFRDTITLAPGETRELQQWVIAPEGLTLRGLVLDAEGDPVEGAVVWYASRFRAQRREAVTGADGRFELTGLDVGGGDCTVIAYDPDARTAFAQPCDPSVAFEPTFALMPLGEVTVTVVDDGEPVPEAIVRLYPAQVLAEPPEGMSLGTMGAEVDEEGRLHLSGLVPGLQYRVMALVGPEDDWTLMGYQEPSFLADEGEVEVTIEMMTREELEALRR